MPKGRLHHPILNVPFSPILRFLGAVSLVLLGSFSTASAQNTVSGGPAGQIIDAQNLSNTPVSALNNQQLAQILGNVPISSLSPQTLQALGIGGLQGINLGNLGLGNLDNLTLNNLGINLSGLPLNNVLGGLGGNIGGLLNPGGIGHLVGVGVPGIGGLGGEKPTILPSAAIAATLRGKCATPSCAAGHHGRTIHDIETHFRDKRHDLEDWMKDDLYEGEMLPALQAMTEQWNNGEEEISMQGAVNEDAAAQVATGTTIEVNQARIVNSLSENDGFCRSMENRETTPAVMHSTRDRGRSLFNTVNANLNGEPGTASSRGPINRSIAVLDNFKSRYCDGAELGGLLANVCGTLADASQQSADIDFDAAARSGDETTMAAYIQNLTNMSAPASFDDTVANLPEVLGYRTMRANNDQINAMISDSIAQNLAFQSGSGMELATTLQNSLAQAGLSPDALQGFVQPENMSQAGFLRTLALAATTPNSLTERLVVNGPALERSTAQYSGSELMFLVNLNEAMQRENRNLSALVGVMTRLQTENANALMLGVSGNTTGNR